MTTSVLIDTDVFSFWLKRDTRGRLYENDVAGKRLCLSFMSFAEAKRWALARRWGPAKYQALDEGLSRYVVFPFDEDLAEAWARIADHRSRLGRPIETGDCWIAATAVRYSIPLVTHNARHYSDIPWLQVVTHAPA